MQWSDEHSTGDRERSGAGRGSGAATPPVRRTRRASQQAGAAGPRQGRACRGAALGARGLGGAVRAPRVGPPAPGGGAAPAVRRDPVAVLEEQALTRVPELIPIRHGRMLVSAFTFYRGAAGLMASDLSRSPHSGLTVQLCGDAHLSNFGAFTAPDRRMVFSLNDFDETHPGPFEWDVKRLVASFAVAGRDNSFDAQQRRGVNLAVARSYREAMHGFAEMRTMDL